jgi:hypothetical protein
MLVKGVVGPPEPDKTVGIVHPALPGRKMIYGTVVILHRGLSFFRTGNFRGPDL